MQVASKKGFYCVRCGLLGVYPLTVRPSAVTGETLFAGLFMDFTWVSAAWRERERSACFSKISKVDTFHLQALQGRTDRSVGQKRRAGSTITSFFFCRTSHPSFLVMKRKVGLHSAGLHSRLLSPGGTLDGGRSGVALGPPRCPGFARTWTGPSPRTTRTSSSAPPASLPAATTQGP